MKSFVLLMLFAFPAFAAEVPKIPAVDTIPGDAEFHVLEARLQRLPAASMRYHIESTGPIPTVVNGELHLDGESVQLYGSAKVKGEDAYTRMPAEGETLPPNTRRALLIGMTRMGLLHNLVRGLMMKQGIDPKPGGADEWVRVTNVVYDLNAHRFTFDIMVEGQQAGEGELTIARDGKPSHRHQIVHFPEGDLTVDENYQWR
ncbi:MAG TPA: hypothetical protein VFN10_01510 [Thermoanaerobaculia bacterium]|nr:hypothetical protein [Thermoanaerobaculia bacterium]